MKNFPKKLITLIDWQDNVLGSENLLIAHTHPAQLHRAVSVWLVRNFRGIKQILLQKRSSKKIVGANQWGNAICGNVRPSETYKECAQRRLKEEIGVRLVGLKPVYRFEYQVYSNKKYGEHELDQVFRGEYDKKFGLNPDETSAVEWINLTELKKEAQKYKIVTASETLNQKTNQLKKLTPALKLKLNGKIFEIAPWTSLMLGDKRLWAMLSNF